ncbi:MAG TPA: OmpA family protein [Thioalkalivibrio sp.]|nr:OmpA family protein [Thioalkalivibrio sp.]
MTRRTPSSEHGRGPTSGRPMVSPLWAGAARIEFEETESEANGDPGWTVSYLDVLLVLVTVFAALLGITYLQTGTFQSAAISESVTEAVPASAHADPTDKLQDPGFLRQTLVVTPGLFYPPVPISKVASIASPSPTSSQPGATKEVSSFESGQAMEDISPDHVSVVQQPPEPAHPVVIPSALKPLADFLVEHERFGDMDVVFDRHQLRVELNNDILFSSGSADLSLAGTALLEELAEAFSDPGLLVAIEGHTDNVPIQTRQFPSNWELSSFRATTVARALITLGVAEHRVKVTGYADTRPRAQNDTERNRALNRRVSIVLELPDPEAPEI